MSTAFLLSYLLPFYVLLVAPRGFTLGTVHLSLMKVPVSYSRQKLFKSAFTVNFHVLNDIHIGLAVSKST